jgi:SH3-like domain-containing protein
MLFSLKTAALAATMLVATVGGSFAATLDHDTKLLDSPHKWADVVSYVDEGDYVKVYGCGFGSGYFCKVKIDGDKGFIRKDAIDWGYSDDDYDVSFCVGGYYGSFCLAS